MICRNCGKEYSDNVCKIHEPWCFEDYPAEILEPEIEITHDMTINNPQELIIEEKKEEPTEEINERLVELQEEAIRLKIASPSVVRRWKNISTIEQKIASI